MHLSRHSRLNIEKTTEVLLFPSLPPHRGSLSFPGYHRRLQWCSFHPYLDPSFWVHLTTPIHSLSPGNDLDVDRVLGGVLIDWLKFFLHFLACSQMAGRGLPSYLSKIKDLLHIRDWSFQEINWQHLQLALGTETVASFLKSRSVSECNNLTHMWQQYNPSGLL